MLININTVGAFIVSIFLVILAYHRPSLFKIEAFFQKTNIWLNFSLILILAYFLFYQATNYSVEIFSYTFPLFLLNSFTLLIHEAGHVYWSWGGETLHSLGGTLNEILFPVIPLIYCLIKSYYYISALLIYWLSINLLGIAFYMSDALVQKLPLLGGGTHDWRIVFSNFNVLESNQQIAWFVEVIGISFGVLALTLFAINIYFQHGQEQGS